MQADFYRLERSQRRLDDDDGFSFVAAWQSAKVQYCFQRHMIKKKNCEFVVFDRSKDSVLSTGRYVFISSSPPLSRRTRSGYVGLSVSSVTQKVVDSEMSNKWNRDLRLDPGTFKRILYDSDMSSSENLPVAWWRCALSCSCPWSSSVFAASCCSCLILFVAPFPEPWTVLKKRLDLYCFYPDKCDRTLL